MAGDWIKMRIDLQSHPKIVRILSEHSTDKFRVIGGLHAVWSVFDTHSEDGILNGYSPMALDHVIGWDGFSASMIGVGWLEQIAGGLVMPEFCEHNGKSGKRRAEDQKRKRDLRKDQENVRNLSANKPDEKLTREEKRREDKDQDQKHLSLNKVLEGELLPDERADRRKPSRVKQESDLINLAQLIAEGCDKQHAKDWLAVRKNKKAPLTLTAWNGVKAEAEKLGMNPAQAVQAAAENGWQGFKASWVQKDQPKTGAVTKHTGFDSRDYHDGLIEREDGSYGF